MPLQEESARSRGHTEKEELKFIFQVAIAPISIFRRMFRENKGFSTALIETIDRDAFLKDLRKKEADKSRSQSQNVRPV